MSFQFPLQKTGTQRGSNVQTVLSEHHLQRVGPAGPTAQSECFQPSWATSDFQPSHSAGAQREELLRRAADAAPPAAGRWRTREHHHRGAQLGPRKTTTQRPNPRTKRSKHCWNSFRRIVFEVKTWKGKRPSERTSPVPHQLLLIPHTHGSNSAQWLFLGLPRSVRRSLLPPAPRAATPARSASWSGRVSKTNGQKQVLCGLVQQALSLQLVELWTRPLHRLMHVSLAFAGLADSLQLQQCP